MRNKARMTAGLVALAFVALARGQEEPIERFIEPRSNIPVVFVAEPDMFPESWVGGDIKGKAESLDPRQSHRVESLIKEALAAYPKQVLTSLLTKVYVCKSIEFYGLEYGGTNSLDRVFLTARTPEQGYTDDYIRGCFHHEFSSIVLRQKATDFDSAGWMACNATGFKYGDGGTEALREGKASTEYDDTLAEQGLLTQYSTASVEEDFNVMIEGLFSGNSEFWKMIDKHDRAKQKMKIAVKFYGKLDPVFSEDFFRKRKVTSRNR